MVFFGVNCGLHVIVPQAISESHFSESLLAFSRPTKMGTVQAPAATSQVEAFVESLRLLAPVVESLSRTSYVCLPRIWSDTMQADRLV